MAGLCTTLSPTPPATRLGRVNTHRDKCQIQRDRERHLGESPPHGKEPLRTRSSMLKHRHFIKIHSALAAAARAERGRSRCQPRGARRGRPGFTAGIPARLPRGERSPPGPAALGPSRSRTGPARPGGSGRSGRRAGKAAPSRGERPGRDRPPGSGAGLARHGRRGCGHWEVESFQGGNKLKLPTGWFVSFPSLSIQFRSALARPRSPRSGRRGQKLGARGNELLSVWESRLYSYTESRQPHHPP